MNKLIFKNMIRDIVDKKFNEEDLDLSFYCIDWYYENFYSYFKDKFKEFLKGKSSYNKDDLEEFLYSFSDEMLLDTDYPGGYIYEIENLCYKVIGELLEDFPKKILREYEAEYIVIEVLDEKIKAPDMLQLLKNYLDSIGFPIEGVFYYEEESV